jgi:hypothetical protein
VPGQAQHDYKADVTIKPQCYCRASSKDRPAGAGCFSPTHPAVDIITVKNDSNLRTSADYTQTPHGTKRFYDRTMAQVLPETGYQTDSSADEKPDPGRKLIVG